MGTMVHIVEGTHHTYKNFFTKEECDHIISIFERDKDIIPYGTDTGYEGLTSTYSEYNWLYNKDIQPLNIPQRLFDLDYFSDWEYMVVQCWGNALHVGEELKEHYHGEIMEEHFRRMYFINCNIFLGGEYNKTWYKDIGYTHNEPGDLHLFSCELDHRVDHNIGNNTRYSMALDIYPVSNRMLMLPDKHMSRYSIHKRPIV